MPSILLAAIAAAILGISLSTHISSVHAQQASVQSVSATDAPANPQEAVFRAQSKLVLVDSVVTDKKGNYIRDLSQKDFRVWEDNKEQEVKSFSYEAQSGASPNDNTKHYLVLFFDNSNMDFADQTRARQAAAKFIETNAGPNRLMALVDFGGTLRITQNFTADADRLKKLVAGTKFATTSPNLDQVAALGAPPIVNAETDFGVFDMLWAVRNLAKNMAAVPGRKSLVLLTSGFPLTPERESEVSAVIDACNKANVAIYPIDVRGLSGDVFGNPQSELRYPTRFSQAHLTTATLTYSGDAQLTPHLLLVQHGGGSGGGGGGHPGGGGPGGGGGGHPGGGGPGGGSGGGKGGSGGGSGGKGGGGGTGGGRGGVGGVPINNANFYNPNFQPNQLVPQFPQNASLDQQVLYELADGTGGFLIHNTNDLLAGMERIAKEQNEYYIVGYTPPDSRDGSCHTIKVKVDRGGTIVRSRTGYCNVKPLDFLADKPIERELESHANASATSTPGSSLEAPFFFTSPNVARVDLTMQIPSASIKFQKEKGKFQSDLYVLGIATKPDGSEAARFSDSVHLEFEKHELEEFNKNPFRYENQFEIGAGDYKLAVVFSGGGETFGKLETTLKVDSFDGKHFGLSSLALSKEAHPVSQIGGLDQDLVVGHVPLVVQGIQVVPTADCHFTKTDHAMVYLEMYEPLLAGPNPPTLDLILRIVNEKSGSAPISGKVANVGLFIKAGNPVVPMGLRVPVDQLEQGPYRLELQGVDSAGSRSPVRVAEFVVN
jgi:VWFA-related protein